RARAAAVGDPANSPALAALLAFTDARLALNTGNPRPDLVRQAHHAGLYDRYATAATAELAAATHHPEAEQLVEAAQRAAEENDWAAACLARARGRLHDDQKALHESLTTWERLGARYERARTLALIPGREPEAASELSAWGVDP
ncbi:MAG: hypothetical protein HOY71_42325, partial [Nonomuraea sp.]|nr:hypothetical protein [Nonomuraea sp.]